MWGGYSFIEGSMFERIFWKEYRSNSLFLLYIWRTIPPVAFSLSHLVWHTAKVDKFHQIPEKKRVNLGKPILATLERKRSVTRSVIGWWNDVTVMISQSAAVLHSPYLDMAAWTALKIWLLCAFRLHFQALYQVYTWNPGAKLYIKP